MNGVAYSINTKDGRIVFRTAEVDEQVNYYPVSERVVDLIRNKKVSVEEVLEAISRNVRGKGDFNLYEYIEQLKKLNVRTSNIVPEDDTPDMTDRSAEESEVEAMLLGGKHDSADVPSETPVETVPAAEPHKRGRKPKKEEEFTIDG